MSAEDISASIRLSVCTCTSLGHHVDLDLKYLVLKFTYRTYGAKTKCTIAYYDFGFKFTMICINKNLNAKKEYKTLSAKVKNSIDLPLLV